MIKASKAKEYVETSTGMIDALSAQIETEAKNNKSVCNWGFYGCSDETIKGLIKVVEDAGFTCTVKKDSEGNVTKEYEISW